MKFLFFNLLNDAGPMFMYPMLLMLIICVALLIKAFLKGDEKTISLIKHLSLFVLIFGFFGFMIGMIGAFDAIAIATDIHPSVLAGGLKVALLTPTFGMLIFLIARLGLIGLTFKNK